MGFEKRRGNQTLLTKERRRKETCFEGNPRKSISKEYTPDLDSKTTKDGLFNPSRSPSPSLPPSHPHRTTSVYLSPHPKRPTPGRDQSPKPTIPLKQNCRITTRYPICHCEYTRTMFQRKLSQRTYTTERIMSIEFSYMKSQHISCKPNIHPRFSPLSDLIANRKKR